MAQGTGSQLNVKVGKLADTTFAVASFNLDKGLNCSFHFEKPDIDFDVVLDQPCELLVWYRYHDVLQRWVCDVVGEFAQGDCGFRRIRFALEAKPALWRLGLRLIAKPGHHRCCPQYIYRGGLTCHPR